MNKHFTIVYIVFIIGLFHLDNKGFICYADNNQSFNNVGFASMRVVKTGNKEQDLIFHDLATYSYRMKWSSFKKIAAKMQKSNLLPKAIEELTLKKYLNPSKKNEKAITFFHESVDAEFDKYLRKLSIHNNSRLLIFDVLEVHHVEKFIKGSKYLNLTVMVYYLDSNTVGVTFIPLKDPLFASLTELKQRFHQAIIEALGEALVLTGSTSYKINTNKPEEKKQSNTNDPWD